MKKKISVKKETKLSQITRMREDDQVKFKEKLLNIQSDFISRVQSKDSEIDYLKKNISEQVEIQVRGLNNSNLILRSDLKQRDELIRDLMDQLNKQNKTRMIE